MTDRRLVSIGAGVVGVSSLLSAGSGGPSSAPILILAAVISGLTVGWGRRILGAQQSSSLLLGISAVMLVLAPLDLMAVLTDLDDLATYGGWWGLIARVGCVAGGGLTLVGALRLWPRHRIGEGERAGVVGSDRLAVGGGLMVVLAWVGMVTSVWFMTADQAFAVAAATIAIIAVLLQTRASLPLSPTWRSVLMVSLAVVTAGMALKSLIGTVGDWDFLVEFGGLRVFGPYVVYLGGAALLGVAGAMEARALRHSTAGVKLDHVATVTLVGLVTVVTLVTGLEQSGGQAEAATATPTTVAEGVVIDDPTDGDTVAVGPEVPPVDGCLLLGDEAVEQALGITDPSGFLLLGGGEACTWRPFDAEPEDGLYVTVTPANPDDFQGNAERDGVAGVEVPEVGDLAVWFGSQGRGVLSVIADTDIGYALVSIEVARPGVDDTARLQAATTLATSAISQLRGESPQTVEASLCELVADAEAEELLAPHRVGRAAARGELHVIGPSAPVDLTEPGDSSCKKLILTEIYVEVASGDPADFEPGADFEGVVAEPVDGVGDEAVWFGGVPRQASFSAPHEAGVLAFREGEAHLRILLSLPDMSTEEQLEAARSLASKVLARVRAGDATVITIEHEARETGVGVELVDNLLAREEMGEWTRGEGLVRTLQMILGETDPEQVVPEGDVLGDDATGIVSMARAHLAEAPDSPLAEELRGLLGMLIFSDAQLEEMAGLGNPTASLGWLWSPEAAATSQNCTAFFTGWEIPGGIGQCLEKRTSPALETSFPGQYKVFGPAPPLPTAGWQDRHFDLAIEAMEEVVPKYKSLGKLPAVNIVFSVIRHATAGATAAPHLAGVPDSQNRPCGVTLFRNIQNQEDLDFKQYVAHELAHCLHGDTFPDQYIPGLMHWWDEGLADYLSNTINEDYAKNNLEWDLLDEFESLELATGILDRKYENFIFFQQLSRSYGNDEAIFDIISNLPPGGGREEQEAALGGYGAMAGNYHEFVEKVSDIAVVDTGKDIIPNAPDSDAYTLDRPTLILDQPVAFGATRLALAVPDGEFACIEHDQSGDVLTSWRPGLPGSPTGDWSADVPDVLTGEAVVVTTATGSGAEMSIYVADVSDEPDCDDDEDESEEAEPECLDLCDPSSYYRFWRSLPEWAQSLLPAP